MRSEAEKLIAQMKKEHKRELARYEDSIAKATVGTVNYARLLEGKSKLQERYRAECVRFGILPENLKQATKTKFVYISHLESVPATDAEVKELLKARMVHALKGRNHDQEKLEKMWDAAYPVGSGDNRNCPADEEKLAEVFDYMDTPARLARQAAFDALQAELDKDGDDNVQEKPAERKGSDETTE